MSVTQHGDKLNFKAGADLSTFQHCAVKESADGVVVVATANTDIVTGFLTNKPKSGETANVANISGGATFKVKLGGTVTRGARLTVNSSSVAIAATKTADGTGPTTYSFGEALQAGVTGDIIEARGGPIWF